MRISNSPHCCQEQGKDISYTFVIGGKKIKQVHRNVSTLINGKTSQPHLACAVWICHEATSDEYTLMSNGGVIPWWDETWLLSCSRMALPMTPSWNLSLNLAFDWNARLAFNKISEMQPVKISIRKKDTCHLFTQSHFS